MILSVREVLTLSERCFRAAEFSEGVAQANAKTIWWSELYKGTGFTRLHELLEKLPDLDMDRLTMREQRSAATVIDGDGQPSVIATKPAVNLACSQATQRGLGLAYASIGEDDDGLSTIGHTAYRAVERGFVPIVLYASGEKSATVLGTPDDPRPRVAEAQLDAPSESYVEIADVISAGLQQQDDPLYQSFFKGRRADEGYAATDARLLDLLLERTTEPAQNADANAGAVVICIDPVHPLHSDGVKRVVAEFIHDRADSFRVFDPDDIAERAATLAHDGVEVERSVWRDVFDFSTGILAPPFEGSEMGAGFDLNDLAE